MRTRSRDRHAARIVALVLTAVMLISSVSYYAEIFSSAAETGTGESAADQPVIPKVTIEVVQKTGRMLSLVWTGPKDIPGAASCRIYKDDSKEGTEVSFSPERTEEELAYVCSDLEYNTQYSFRVLYFDENGGEIVSSDAITVRSAVEPPQKRSLKSFKISSPPRLLGNGAAYNLRKYAGEPSYGYSIVQGSCVDSKGEYAYYCLVDSSDYGRLVKVRVRDNAKVAVSGVHRFAHGNGMCFDSKRNKVVITSRDYYRKRLLFVDPDNLDSIQQKDVTYKEIKRRLDEYGAATTEGVSAIAYNAKYDCYITMQKSAHNIIIYDAETLRAKAAAITSFDSRFSGIFQSIDADDTYVYFLLSKNGDSQPYNLLVAFDWHAENYEDLLNGSSDEDIWMCGSGAGRHSAVIRVTYAKEIESMYHTDAGEGRGHFYLTNYDEDPHYDIEKKKVKWKKVKKKVKVKKKWKKVWKKVKWKKVKTKSGKTKWKYKKKKVWKYKYTYKTKKVWKYKTKKIKVFSHYNRDNYVLDLGVF